jgi:hypothetical protein
MRRNDVYGVRIVGGQQRMVNCGGRHQLTALQRFETGSVEGSDAMGMGSGHGDFRFPESFVPTGVTHMRSTQRAAMGWKTTASILS